MSFRRVFKKEDYALKAQFRQANAMPVAEGIVLENLDFESHVNTSKTVLAVDESGFTCVLCSLTFKDNHSYLEHLNKREHLDKVDISKTRATVDQVRQRLLRKKTIIPKVDPAVRFQQRLLKEQLEKLTRKQNKKDKIRRRRRKRTKK